MIAVPAGMRVLVATKPIDFRKGADGLVALVRETLGHDPFSGTIFVFRAKRQDKDRGVGWFGSGAFLEAAGAWCLPMAADHRWRDEVEFGTTCRVDATMLDLRENPLTVTARMLQAIPRF